MSQRASTSAPLTNASLSPRPNALRAALLAGASAAALLAVPMGVMAPGVARADVEIIANQGELTLSDNTTIANGVSVTNGGGAAVINRGGFRLTNKGTVSGSFGVDNAFLSGTIDNSGVIISDGSDFAIFMGNGGSILNTGEVRGEGTGAGAIMGQQRTTIDNQGTIKSFNSGAKIIYIKDGGAVISNSGVIRGDGPGIIVEAGNDTTVTNTGTITVPAGAYDAIDLRSGGTILNTGTGALIQSGGKAVGVNGGTGVLTNEGTIQGGSSYGVLFNVGGTVTNKAGGTIKSTGLQAVGVFGFSGGNYTSSVSNAGLISGVTAGVRMNTRTSILTNASGATIEATTGGDRGAVWMGYNTNATVTNAGTIRGANGKAIVFSNVGASVLLVLDSGSVIDGNASINGTPTTSKLALKGTASQDLSKIIGFKTLEVYNGANATVSGEAPNFSGGIAVQGTGKLTNTGTIGQTVNVVAGGAVENKGTADGASSHGITLANGGTVSNTGSISLIKSGYRAIETKVGTGIVTNEGTIQGGSSYGVLLDAGGTLTNKAGGTIKSTGGQAVGIFGFSGGNYTSSVSNAGLISGVTAGVRMNTRTSILTNASGATIEATTGGDRGAVWMGYNTNATVTNAGTIRGANGKAIVFSNVGASVLLVLDSGSVIDGNASINGTPTTSKLALKGTASQDLSKIIGFKTLEVYNGANATVSGEAPSFSGGVTIQGNGKLTNTGTIAQTVAIAANGAVENRGTVDGGTGNGVYLTAGGTVSNKGAASLIKASIAPAVNVRGSAGVLTNEGTIEGALFYSDDATVNNTAGGTIKSTSDRGLGVRGTGIGSVSNAGLISGVDKGVQFDTATSILTNAAGGTIEQTGTGGYYAAVYMLTSLNATITNAGTIRAASANDMAIAIRDVQAGASVVVELNTGSRIDGKVEIAGTQDAATTSLLRLKGSGTEDLSKFIGFKSLNLNQGGSWHLTSSAGSATFATFTNAGTLTPGSSNGTPATLKITGNFVQTSTGLLRIGLKADGTNGKLDITGAAQLGGGVNFFGAVDGETVLAGNRVFLTASDGVTGTFATTTNDLAYLDANVVYEANQASVNLSVRGSTPDTGGGSTPPSGGDTPPSGDGSTPDTGGGGLQVTVDDSDDGILPLAISDDSETTPIKIQNGGGAFVTAGATSGVNIYTIKYASVAETPAQKALGDALGNLKPGGPLEDFLSNLAGQTTAGARETLAQVSSGGTAQASVSTSTASLGRSMSGSPMKAMGGGAPGRTTTSQDPSLIRVQFADNSLYADAGSANDASFAPERLGGLGAWVTGFGSFGSIGGADGEGGASFTSGGGAVGLDKAITPEVTLGVALGFARADSDQDEAAVESSVDSTSLSLYGGWRANTVYVTGTMGYAYSSIETTRFLSLPTDPVTAGEARGKTHGNQLLAEVETGMDIAQGAYTLTPFVGLQASKLWQSAYTEDGAGDLNMAMAATSTPSLRTILGGQVQRELALGEKSTVDVTLRLGWAHELRSSATGVDLAFAAAPAASFRVDGVAPQKDSALVGLGFGMDLSQVITGFVRYDGDLGKKDQTNTVSAGLRYSW